MKLYKFRSLATDEDTNRAITILETGQFWCSKFWELNDPMEGIYKYYSDTYVRTTLERVFTEKSKCVLCSFSDRWALKNPLMWGYYANGFKGAAIEVEVTPEDVKKVKYTDDPPVFGDAVTNAEDILTHKLKRWRHEREHRYITRSAERGLCEVGRITGVYLGSPYSKIENAGDVQQQEHLRDYKMRADRIRDAATKHGVWCRFACLSTSGKVSVQTETANEE